MRRGLLRRTCLRFSLQPSIIYWIHMYLYTYAHIPLCDINIYHIHKVHSHANISL